MTKWFEYRRRNRAETQKYVCDEQLLCGQTNLRTREKKTNVTKEQNSNNNKNNNKS